jgi:hypothetical protein
MGLIFDEVTGELPLVERVWAARFDAEISFVSVAKASTMISFARNDVGWSVYLHGPETSASNLTCPPGWEFFGVELQIGAHIPMFPPSGIADLNDALLPTLSSGRIQLGDRDWEMPTAQNVDVFVARLVRAGLLVIDPLVEEMRHGERPRAVSERTAQIRFRRAVGVSRRKFASIERSRAAARLLSAGGSTADAVSVGSYYDQPQLTRAMRWATGHTPGELRAGPRFLAF